jgi:pimeloyl-ACP methyl ester carboxylesterase
MTLSKLVVPVLGVALTFAHVAVADTTPTVVSVTEVREGDLTNTQTVYSRSANAIDRFTLHHLASCGHPKGTIFFLPPLGFNFDFYEVSDTGDWSDSLPATLVREGYDVYGYSPGMRGLTAGVCESGSVDCSIMANWGLASVISDARFINGVISTGGQRPLIAGISIGAMSVIATLNDDPKGYAGAILWEGALYSADAGVKSLNQQWCQDEQAVIAGGKIYDDSLNPYVKLIVSNAQTAPTQATVFPGYPAGTTNYDAFVEFMASPPQSPVTAVVPGLEFAAANSTETAFLTASDTRAFQAVAGLDDYVPQAVVRDMNCSLAGDRTFTSNLGAFTGPIYAAGAGLGFGERMADNLALFGSRSVQFVVTPGIGHEEHFLSKEHEQLLEQPLSAWLSHLPKTR